MPTLLIKILTGPLKGTEQRFDRFPIVLGRSPDCAIPLSGDDRISRSHARIRHVPQGFVIEDLQSKNGTCVNGAPVQHWNLSDGDLISLGDQKLLYKLQK